MRIARAYVAVLLSLVLTISVFGQQAASSSPEALSLLQKSLAVLTGGQSISDVTLSGGVRRVAGSDDESGTGTFKALSAGASNISLSLSTGQRAEVCNLTATTPAGDWSGPDGVSHAIAYHNLLNEPAWFFPAFAIARRLSSSGYLATYIGHETHNGQAVEHVSVSQSSSLLTPPGPPTFQHLTQVDFFLDSSTLLPAAISFNVHPDNDATADILIEARFSDYRAVGSLQVPYHVQKYVNNGLFLDFQVQTVTPNTGLTVGVFAVQTGL